MSKWLLKASELNRCGASLIQAGNEQLALEYFKSALEIISLLAMGSIGDDSAPEPPAEAPPSPKKYSDPLALSSSSTQPPTLEDDPANEPERPEGEVHYLFERALTFHVDLRGTVTTELLSFYLAVVEFNMALSLQLLSRRYGEKALCNALQIYNCCLDHLHRSGCGKTCNTLLFAALNNKAAIFYSVSNFQTARDTLASLLEGVNSCRTEGEGLSFVEDQDLEGFLFNVMLLRGARIAPAA